MGNCIDSDPNFNDNSSLFHVLNKIEEENKKMKLYAEKSYEVPNLAKKCVYKTEHILNFVKNKPLYYIEERLSKFKEILTRFYTYSYRYEIDNYNKAEEDLQEFILNMMDYYNGIRISVVEKKNNTTEDIIKTSNTNLTKESNNLDFEKNYSEPFTLRNYTDEDEEDKEEYQIDTFR